MAVISAGGRVRRTNAFFPPCGKGHLCLSCARARLILYFLRGVPLNTPRRTRLRIQVRRSTYVRLGFRSFTPTTPLPASSFGVSERHRRSPFRHFRYMQSDPENTHIVLYNHQILEYGLSFIVQLASIRLRVKWIYR